MSLWGIAADGSGNVYVADTANNRVQKFTSTGTFVTKWGSFGTGDGQFDAPYGDRGERRRHGLRGRSEQPPGPDVHLNRCLHREVDGDGDQPTGSSRRSGGSQRIPGGSFS